MASQRVQKTGVSCTAGERVVGYIRVSTDDQADSGAGLEAQRAAILAECARRGWTLTGIHEDAGASGKAFGMTLSCLKTAVRN